MARPSLTEQRTLRVNLSLTRAEFQRLTDAAQLHLLPVSVYARQKALAQPVSHRINHRAVVQLIRIGTNLNQLARAANIDGNTRLVERDLRPALAALSEAIDHLEDL